MHNFGKIKNAFNNFLAEGIVKKDKKARDLFKKYLKTIKESKFLKTEFLVYNNLENKIDKDLHSVGLFVNENIKLLESFSREDITTEHKKLIDILKLNNINVESKYDMSSLHESISRLIFTKRTPKNIGALTNELANIINYIVLNEENNKADIIDMPISFLTNLMVQKYNDKYNLLDEDDKRVIKTLINSDFEEKKKLYLSFVSECIELVNGLLKEADNDSKDKLLRAKNKLETETEINESDFVIKIAKVVELKNKLKCE